MSDALVFAGFYLFGAAMCAFILSAGTTTRRQARGALLVSLVWPLAAVALTLGCLFLIGEALFSLVAKAVRS